MKRNLVGCCLMAAGALASADRVLLVPLDSRPATGQFAQMIAKIANVEVDLPPTKMLGRFTQPGDPAAILDWLKRQNYDDVLAVVVSSDMIAYGGLIASRTRDTELAAAIANLNRLAAIRKLAPKSKFYLMSATMRLTPTATRDAAAWRIQLGRYAEVRERQRLYRDPQSAKLLKSLQGKIPPAEIAKYEQTRSRNQQVQQHLIRQMSKKFYDYLIFGQDDAQPIGPHIPETRTLRELAGTLGVAANTSFGEGVDQLANVLVSRALLRARGWTPRVRLAYSDKAAARRVADYESKPIEASLRDQLLASGSRPASGQEYDFALFLNTPREGDSEFDSFLESLTTEVDQGFPVSVADINLAKNGMSDPALFNVLNQENRMIRLLSYAGWNTAGNTMGTAIPAANVYLLARRQESSGLERELARREFILHRFVNDYCYHKFVRPQAYKMIDSSPNASREETYGPVFDEVNSMVGDRLREYLEDTYAKHFLGQRFFAGSKQYEIDALKNIRISLPWPRAYEVRLEFELSANEVGATNGEPYGPHASRVGIGDVQV